MPVCRSILQLIESMKMIGCEIQNTADGVSGMLMQLKLVNTSSEEYLHSPEEHDVLLYGTKVMLTYSRRYSNHIYI